MYRGSRNRAELRTIRMCLRHWCLCGEGHLDKDVEEKAANVPQHDGSGGCNEKRQAPWHRLHLLVPPMQARTVISRLISDHTLSHRGAPRIQTQHLAGMHILARYCRRGNVRKECMFPVTNPSHRMGRKLKDASLKAVSAPPPEKISVPQRALILPV
jgi:hypothetical protein